MRYLFLSLCVPIFHARPSSSIHCFSHSLCLLSTLFHLVFFFSSASVISRHAGGTEGGWWKWWILPDRPERIVLFAYRQLLPVVYFWPSCRASSPAATTTRWRNFYFGEIKSRAHQQQSNCRSSTLFDMALEIDTTQLIWRNPLAINLFNPVSARFFFFLFLSLRNFSTRLSSL